MSNKLLWNAQDLLEASTRSTRASGVSHTCPQGKRTTCNCQKSGRGGDFFVQLYGRNALIAPINGTVVQRSCDVHN